MQPRKYLYVQSGSVYSANNSRNGFKGSYFVTLFLLPVASIVTVSAQAQGPAEHQTAVVGQGHTNALVGSLTSFDTDGDNALNIGDYARAQMVFSERIKNLGKDKRLFCRSWCSGLDCLKLCFGRAIWLLPLVS